MFASKRSGFSGSRDFDEIRTPRDWAELKRTECYDWDLKDLLMLYVSCFHNLFAVAWPDSLEAVENSAERIFFSLPLSTLCGARRGG